MDKVKIQTSQNIEIDYEVSNIGDRFLALLIDFLIIFGIYIFAFIVLARIFNYGNELAVIMFVIFLIGFFYHFISEITMNGQSIGKRARGIKVIKTDGTQATIGNYFIRFILRPVDSVAGIGLIIILFNGKGQRLGDIAAGTTVIKLKKRISISDALAVQILDDYVPVFSKVINLNDKDINIIKEVLKTRRNQRDHQNLHLLAAKLQETLDIQANMQPLEFLETIVKDYTYYHTRGN